MSNPTIECQDEETPVISISKRFPIIPKVEERYQLPRMQPPSLNIKCQSSAPLDLPQKTSTKGFIQIQDSNPVPFLPRSTPKPPNLTEEQLQEYIKNGDIIVIPCGDHNLLAHCIFEELTDLIETLDVKNESLEELRDRVDEYGVMLRRFKVWNPPSPLNTILTILPCIEEIRDVLPPPSKGSSSYPMNGYESNQDDHQEGKPWRERFEQIKPKMLERLQTVYHLLPKDAKFDVPLYLINQGVVPSHCTEKN